MDSSIIISVLIAVGAGAAIGWFLGSRPVADWKARHAERDGEARDLDEKFKAAIRDLAGASERANHVEQLSRELEESRRAQSAAATELATLREKTANFEEQKRLLVEAQETLRKEFEIAGAKVLAGAQETFLTRAAQRLDQAGEKSESKLKELLQPFDSTLKRYEENLARVEKERVSTYSELNKVVGDLAQTNIIVRSETQRLANVLRSSPKARGRWGEEQLRTILSNAGLAENVDFELQTSVSDGEKQLRPDCVINLPGGRCIVVDVKCPLNAFEQAYDEEDESRRSDLLLAHANAIRAYANDLGKKSYWRQFDKSPDFVILFVPGEHFLSAAAERAPKLIEDAFNNGVIIASTINMLALAKVMAGMWRQEALAEQAHAIHEVGKELYERLLTMGAHVSRLGKNLSTATEAYNSFVGSLESKVLTQAKRFKDLKVGPGNKSVDTPPMVEFSPRPLTKLGALDEEADHDTR